MIHVSPLQDDLPETVAADWWPIRPNTDTALMLGLAQEIVRSGQHDLAFLERYTSGSERFLDYLAGRIDGEEKTAEWAAGIEEKRELVDRARELRVDPELALRAAAKRFMEDFERRPH